MSPPAPLFPLPSPLPLAPHSCCPCSNVTWCLCSLVSGFFHFLSPVLVAQVVLGAGGSQAEAVGSGPVHPAAHAGASGAGVLELIIRSGNPYDRPLSSLEKPRCSDLYETTAGFLESQCLEERLVAPGYMRPRCTFLVDRSVWCTFLVDTSVCACVWRCSVCTSVVNEGTPAPEQTSVG